MLARCAALLLVVELRVAETLEAPPSGLGPPPVVVPLDGGGCGGVDGCSRTVCGTSTPGNDCCCCCWATAAGAKPGVTGEEGMDWWCCCSWRWAAHSSSMGVALAMPVPGLRMGNSSSSRELDMGMGPEMRPRMVWWPVRGLCDVVVVVVGGEAGGGPPKILAFMLTLSTEAVCLGPDKRNLRGGLWSVVVLAVVSGVVGGSGPGPDDPFGITINLWEEASPGSKRRVSIITIISSSQPCRGGPHTMAINAQTIKSTMQSSKASQCHQQRWCGEVESSSGHERSKYVQHHGMIRPAKTFATSLGEGKKKVTRRRPTGKKGRRQWLRS